MPLIAQGTEQLGVVGIVLVAVIVGYSIILHEIAHGWAALKCGDPTAEALGRITLNPIPHIDPIGTVIFPALQIMTTGVCYIGWARPVPVNPLNYGNKKRDDIFVSLAGIVVNLALAVIFAVLLGVLEPVAPLNSPNFMALFHGVWINVALACFNLLPIPPLDGSHVVKHYLPPEWRESYERVGFYGIFILLALIVSGALGAVLRPPLRFLTMFLLDLAFWIRSIMPY